MPPTPPVDPGSPSTGPSAPDQPPGPPDAPGRSGLFVPLVILAAVVAFAVVIAVAVVVTRPADDQSANGVQAMTSPSTTDVLRDPTDHAELSTTEAPTTEAPTDPPTSPSTTSEQAGLATQLGEDATAGQLRVPAKPAAKGQFKDLNEVDGQPVSFDACRTIHYVVRVGAGPANGLALVTEAIRRLSAATGLRFQYDGPTNTVPQWEEPSKSRDVTDVGSEFTPVFIGWATPAETDIWAHAGKDVLGVGGPETLSFDNGAGELYVTGHAVLLPNADVSPTFGPGVTEGNLLLHELGHVVGLDHVTETGETMEPDLTKDDPDGYGPGDLQGLYGLGSSRGCASSWLLNNSGTGNGQ
jgi:hypothetical protein